MMRDDEYRETLRDGSGLDRREFLKLLGSGITVTFVVRSPLTWAQRGGEYPEDFNAYLRIGEDGRVSCFSGKIEMGQGIVTSLAQMAAEELDVALSSVDMVLGDTALCPWDMGTFGSRSTKYFGPALRRAAAEAKEVLLQLASDELGVSKDDLMVSDGVITVRETPERKVSYAQLTKGKKIARHVKGEIPTKPLSQHTVSGKPSHRMDAEKKVTGQAQYAGDIRIRGMLYAKILRPPAHGAKLVSVDVSRREMKGTTLIEEEDLVAVLHEHPDEAERALERIKSRYEEPPENVDNDTIFEHLVQSAPPGETVTERGNLQRGQQLAAKAFESSYFNHYVAHAPVEPHTAMAQIEGGKATVWASTQTPFRAQEEVARTLGIPSENVRVITPFVGGGFGGKTRNQQVVEAARLAQLTGRPVQVAWSRKEEFFYDTFRPAAVIKIKSGIDSANRIVYWDYDNFFAGTRSSQPFYDIPHHRVVSRGSWRGADSPHPFPVGAWRGPGSNTNVFAMESQVDIMAEAAGMGPLEFRLENLSNRRMKRVLQAAADKFGERFAETPSGRGYGIACTDYLGTYVATMAEVKMVEERGKIRVERVVCAQDMGEVVNPQGAKLQMEGCLVMGLGYVLSEELRFRGGKVLDENFDTYEISRFSWLPKIETVLVDNPDMPPQGCGEPAITTMGAVIANAVYDAIGTRLYELPMTPERVRKALQKS